MTFGKCNTLQKCTAMTQDIRQSLNIKGAAALNAEQLNKVEHLSNFQNF